MPEYSTRRRRRQKLPITGDNAADAREAAEPFKGDGRYFRRGGRVLFIGPISADGQSTEQELNKEDVILHLDSMCELVDHRPKRTGRRSRAEGPVNLSLPTAALTLRVLRTELPRAPAVSLLGDGANHRPVSPTRQERQRAAQIELWQELWNHFGPRPFTTEDFRNATAVPGDPDSPSRQQVAARLAKLRDSQIPGFEVLYQRNGRWPAGRYSLRCSAAPPPIPSVPPPRKRAVLLVPVTAAQRGQRLRRERERQDAMKARAACTTAAQRSGRNDRPEDRAPSRGLSRKENE